MNKDQQILVIKVCPDPQCESVYHNCPVKNTKCQNCNGRVMRINQETFDKKFSNHWFQYDFTTMDYFRPTKSQLILDL